MKVQSNSPLQIIPKDYTLEDKYNHWFTIPEGLGQGKKMFYYDHKPVVHTEKIVLLVHGNFECSYTYRQVRDTILAQYKSARIVAMDQHFRQGDL